MARNILRI